MEIEQQGFRAIQSELSPLLAQIAAHANQLALPSHLAHKLALVLEELFLNSVHHGRRDGVEGKIYLSVHTTAEVVQIIYEDDGAAYDPFLSVDRAVLQEDSDNRRIGGLGILLVEGLATSAHYARHAERNRIELSFAREPPTR